MGRLDITSRGFQAHWTGNSRGQRRWSISQRILTGLNDYPKREMCHSCETRGAVGSGVSGKAAPGHPQCLDLALETDLLYALALADPCCPRRNSAGLGGGGPSTT